MEPRAIEQGLGGPIAGLKRRERKPGKERLSHEERNVPTCGMTAETYST